MRGGNACSSPATGLASNRFICRASDGALIFASELKGLLAHPMFRRVPIRRRSTTFWGSVTSPTTPRSWGRRKLAAGHISCQARHGHPGAGALVGCGFHQPDQCIGIGAQRRADGALREAVRSRMVADVPLGAFLSGGVDSSLLSHHGRGEPIRSAHLLDRLDESASTKPLCQNHRRPLFDQARTRIVSAEDFAGSTRSPMLSTSPLPTPLRLRPIGSASWLARRSRSRCRATAPTKPSPAIGAIASRSRGACPPLGAGGARKLIGRLGDIYPNSIAPRDSFAPRRAAGARQVRRGTYAEAVGVTPPGLRDLLYTDGMRRSLQGHRAEDRYVAAMRAAPAEDRCRVPIPI